MRFSHSFTVDLVHVSGILLDNYQINYYTKTLFPGSDFKTDEVYSEEELSYGAMVNDTYLAKCFKTLIAEDKYMLYDFIRKELKNTLKVVQPLPRQPLNM